MTLPKALRELRELLRGQRGSSPAPASSPNASPIATKGPPMGAISDIAATIEHRLGYHPNLTDDIGKAHDKVRSILTEAAKDALAVATTVAPWSREISLAMTAIEDADQWLHAHIARNQSGVVAPPAPAAPAVPTPDVPAPAGDAPPAAPAPADVAPVVTNPATVAPDAVPPAVVAVPTVDAPLPAASSSTPPVPDPAPVAEAVEATDVVEVTLPEAEVAPATPPATPDAGLAAGA